jgi:hypothetical protein
MVLDHVFREGPSASVNQAGSECRVITLVVVSISLRGCLRANSRFLDG